MRKKILSCLLLLLLSNLAIAQQHLVDSIAKELKGPMPDSNRAMSMMRLAVDYEVVNTAKAFRAYRDAIQFAQEKRLYYHLGRTYQNHAFLLTTTNSLTLAVNNLDTAISYYQKSDHPKAKQYEAAAYGDKANILKQQNESQLAVEYYLKSIALYEKLGLHDKLANTYGNLSNLFGDMEEEAKQMEYANKAVAAAKLSGSGRNVSIAYIMLTNAYCRRNDSRNARIILDSLRKYYNEAENVDHISMLFSFNLISGQVFRINDQLDSAFYFFHKGLEFSNTYTYNYGKAESKLQLGAVSILQKKYPQAEKYLLTGIEEAKAINYYGMLDDGYKYLSDIYAVTDRYKEAYEYFQLYKEASDSSVSMESKKYATELEKKYESEKKDKQIKLQQAQLLRRKTLNYVLIGSAAALLIIILLSYRYYKQRQKLQQQRISELEKDKQLTATEAILKGEEQERTRLAKDLHDGLGGMLSGIKYSFQTMKGNLIMTPDNHQAFERSMDMLDSSIKEMRRVAHNMMPEALVKFGLDTALKDFCNDINQSGALRVTYQSIGLENATIEQTTAIAIYRIVQELINNTMKHAAAKTAIVQVTKTNGNISITVEDDGKGFDPVILESERGIGWSNIRSRVEYLKGKIDIQSEPAKGTSVLIELKG
jgi:two-component system NarL family sensor kinase